MQVSNQCSQDDIQIELSRKKCVPCKSKDLRPMGDESANELLKQIPGWNLLNDGGCMRLHRAWKAKNFVLGLEFLKRVADVAESEGHHPDVHLVNWNNVNIDIWTHAIGGLTENDFILAAKISALDVQDLLRKPATGKKLSSS
eukprot:c23299_g1_i1 orf=289-717(-)